MTTFDHFVGLALKELRQIMDFVWINTIIVIIIVHIVYNQISKYFHFFVEFNSFIHFSRTLPSPCCLAANIFVELLRQHQIVFTEFLINKKGYVCVVLELFKTFNNLYFRNLSGNWCLVPLLLAWSRYLQNNQH